MVGCTESSLPVGFSLVAESRDYSALCSFVLCSQQGLVSYCGAQASQGALLLFQIQALELVGFCSFSSRAPEQTGSIAVCTGLIASGMCNLPGPGIKPMFPAVHHES